MNQITTTVGDTAPTRIKYSPEDPSDLFCESDQLQVLIFTDGQRTTVAHTVNAEKSWHGGLLLTPPNGLAEGTHHCSLKLTSGALEKTLNNQITWLVER